MNKKYELVVDDTISFLGKTLFRIKAKMTFGNVKEGELGGYIEKESNLSHSGDAWVSGNARVGGDARVSGDAWVSGNTQVDGNAWVDGDAWVSGDARVSGNARVKSLKDYIVFKNNWSSGRYFTYTKSNKMWRVGCFYGTSQELIDKAYKDSENSGKHYEAYVKFVEMLEDIENE